MSRPRPRQLRRQFQRMIHAQQLQAARAEGARRRWEAARTAVVLFALAIGAALLGRLFGR